MPISKELLKQIENNDPKLTKVNLCKSFPALTGEDMEELVAAIKKNNNPYIKTLIIVDNCIGDKGVIAISQLTTLKNLSVDGNDIGNEGAFALAKLPHLKKLTISGNKIGDEGFEILLQHPTLDELFINDNAITNEGAKLALQNQTLTTLYMKPIGEEGIKLSPEILNEIEAHIKQNKGKKTNLSSLLPKDSLLSSSSTTSTSTERKRKLEEIFDSFSKMDSSASQAFIADLINRKLEMLSSEEEKMEFITEVLELTGMTALKEFIKIK